MPFSATEMKCVLGLAREGRRREGALWALWLTMNLERMMVRMPDLCSLRSSALPALPSTWPPSRHRLQTESVEWRGKPGHCHGKTCSLRKKSQMEPTRPSSNPHLAQRSQYTGLDSADSAENFPLRRAKDPGTKALDSICSGT